MKKIIFSLAIMLGLAACSDPNDGSMFVEPTELESEMSVTDVLEKSPSEFSLWLQLLKHANYYNALKDASATATVFCPTNEAMEKFLRWRGVSDVSELPVDYARNVVKTHIINGATISEATVDNTATDKGQLANETLFGSLLSLSYGYTVTDVDDAQRTSEIHVADSIFFNNQARLERFTVTSCANGNIFVMGDVIRPLTETILGKLDQEGEYTIFANAIREAQYDSIANLVADTTMTASGTRVITQHRFTCFAVPDVVFHNAGINDVAQLKQWLVTNGEETDAAKALTHYLEYHFLPREYTTADIFNFQTDDETLIFDTKFNGQAVIANLVAGDKTLNKTIKIVRSDINACNGKINKVDNIMPVYHPTPVVVKWDFLNSADIISIVNAYGRDKQLGDLFTSPMENSERKVDLSNEHFDGDYGTPTSFIYESTETKSVTRNYRRVGYTKEKYASASKKTEGQYGAYMNNYLTLNLGYTGWVEFTTPTIIAGKYKVVLHYVKDVTMSPLYNTGTTVQFDLDDNRSTIALYKGQPTMPLYSIIENTLWSSLTFEGSDVHKFRITMLDIQAKTSGTYHHMLDYVEFIPID